jgi:DNA gyrase subunit A
VVSSKEKQAHLLTLSRRGFGKRTKISQYRVQKRGGSGIKTAKITDKTGPLVASKIIWPDFEELIAISKKGQILKTRLKEIPESGRQTQGVRIMRLKSGDGVASLTCL